MKFSERDKKLAYALKDSWKHTDKYIKIMIIGELFFLFSLVGYGMRYLLENGMF